MTFQKNTSSSPSPKKYDDVINEAVDLSLPWYDEYIRRHTYELKRLTPDVTKFLAIARYEWLLSTAKNSVLSTFSDSELYEVTISLQRELAIPNDYPLARAVADDNWIVWEKYKSSKFAELIDKLLLLTPLEEMALRDIVEPFWYATHELHEWFPEYIKKVRARKD